MRAYSLRQLALAGLTGLLYPLCFPNFDAGFLAWGLLIPLHIAIGDVPPRRAFGLGWLAGGIAFAGTMFWVVTAMHLYGKMPLAWSYLALAMLSAYLGLYVSLYALAVKLGVIAPWPPTDMPWNVRECHIRHPDGHIFRVSASLEDET